MFLCTLKFIEEQNYGYKTFLYTNNLTSKMLLFILLCILVIAYILWCLSRKKEFFQNPPSKKGNLKHNNNKFHKEGVQKLSQYKNDDGSFDLEHSPENLEDLRESNARLTEENMDLNSNIIFYKSELIRVGEEIQAITTSNDILQESILETQELIDSLKEYISTNYFDQNKFTEYIGNSLSNYESISNIERAHTDMLDVFNKKIQSINNMLTKDELKLLTEDQLTTDNIQILFRSITTIKSVYESYFNDLNRVLKLEVDPPTMEAINGIYGKMKTNCESRKDTCWKSNGASGSSRQFTKVEYGFRFDSNAWLDTNCIAQDTICDDEEATTFTCSGMTDTCYFNDSDTLTASNYNREYSSNASNISCVSTTPEVCRTEDNVLVEIQGSCLSGNYDCYTVIADSTEYSKNKINGSKKEWRDNSCIVHDNCLSLSDAKQSVQTRCDELNQICYQYNTSDHSVSIIDNSSSFTNGHTAYFEDKGADGGKCWTRTCELNSATNIDRQDLCSNNSTTCYEYIPDSNQIRSYTEPRSFDSVSNKCVSTCAFISPEDVCENRTNTCSDGSSVRNIYDSSTNSCTYTCPIIKPPTEDADKPLENLFDISSIYDDIQAAAKEAVEAKAAAEETAKAAAEEAAKAAAEEAVEAKAVAEEAAKAAAEEAAKAVTEEAAKAVAEEAAKAAAEEAAKAVAEADAEQTTINAEQGEQATTTSSSSLFGGSIEIDPYRPPSYSPPSYSPPSYSPPSYSPPSYSPPSYSPPSYNPPSYNPPSYSPPSYSPPSSYTYNDALNDLREISANGNTNGNGDTNGNGNGNAAIGDGETSYGNFDDETCNIPECETLDNTQDFHTVHCVNSNNTNVRFYHVRNYHDDCKPISNDHELDDVYVEVDKSSNTAYFKAPKLFDSKSIYSLTVIIIDHQTFLQNYSANIPHSDIYDKLRDRPDVLTISIVLPSYVSQYHQDYIDPDDSNRIKISLNNGDHILRWIYGGETNTLPDGDYRLMYHTLTGTRYDRGDYSNHINFTIGTPGPEDNTPLNPHRDETALYAYYQERINEKFRMMRENNEPTLSDEEEKEKKQADFEREYPAYVEFRNVQRHARGTSRLRIINEDIEHDNNVLVWIIRCRALPSTTEGTSIEIYVGATKELPEDDKNPLKLTTQLKFATDLWNGPWEDITYRRIQTFPIHIYKGLYCNVRNFTNPIMVRLSYMNSEDPEIHNGEYTNEATCDPYVLMMPPKITSIEPIIYKSIDTRVGVFTGRCLCKPDVLTQNGSDAYSITIDKGSSGSAAYFILELKVIIKDKNGQIMNEMTTPIYNLSEFFNNNDPIHYSVADPSFVYPNSQLKPQSTSWSEQRYFRARGIGNRQFSFQLIKRAQHLPKLGETTNDEGKQTNDHYLHLVPIFNDEDIHHVEYSNLAEAPPFTPFTGNGDENTTFQGISYSPLPDTTNRTPPVYVPSIVDCYGNKLDEDGNIEEDTVEVESEELETEAIESEAMEDRRYYSTASNLKNYPLCEPISQDTCLAAENKPLYIDSETCNKYNEIDRYIELMKVQIGEAREIRKKGYDLLKSNNISYSFNNGTNENEFDENQTPQKVGSIEIVDTNIDNIELGINTLTEVYDEFTRFEEELKNHYDYRAIHKNRYGVETHIKDQSGIYDLQDAALSYTTHPCRFDYYHSWSDGYLVNGNNCIDRMMPSELSENCRDNVAAVHAEYMINQICMVRIKRSLESKYNHEMRLIRENNERLEQIEYDRTRYDILKQDTIDRCNARNLDYKQKMEDEGIMRTEYCHDGDFDCEWKYVDEDGNERTRQEYIACDDEIFHVREQINTNCTVHTVCGLDSYHFDSNIGRYRIQTSCRYFDNMSIVDGYNRFYPIGTRGKFYDPHKDIPEEENGYEFPDGSKLAVSAIYSNCEYGNFIRRNGQLQNTDNKNQYNVSTANNYTSTMINLGEETQHISDWRQEHPQIIYEDTYVEMKNNKVYIYVRSNLASFVGIMVYKYEDRRKVDKIDYKGDMAQRFSYIFGSSADFSRDRWVPPNYMKFTIIQKYIKVKNKDPDASGGFKTLYIQNLSSSLEPNTEYQMLLKLRENSSRYTAGPVYTINFRTENIINADEISIDSEKDILFNKTDREDFRGTIYGTVSTYWD